MEHQDIRQSILWQLDDIKDVERLCYVDRSFNKLCSREFWIHWYNKKGLKMMKIFNNVEDWINEYRYIEKIQDKTKELMDFLNQEYVLLIYFYIADPDNVFTDPSLYPFLEKNKGKKIRCEIKKNSIYHIRVVNDDDFIADNYHNSYYKSLVSVYPFVFNVLYQGSEIKKYETY